MNYINTESDSRYRLELGKFISNYSNQNHNKDWDYIVGLSYKNNIRNEKIGRRKLKNLYNNLIKYDDSIDGIFVNEYDRCFNKIHHHLVLNSQLKDYDLKYRIIKYWKNIGLSDVEKFDSSLGYGIYISKHIGKTEINSWDFLSNL
jgi:hypothetical protein